MKTTRLIAFFLLNLLFLGWSARSVFAQPALLNMASTLIIADKDAKDGDIMVLTEKNETLVRATKVGDDKMYGVLIANPTMVYRTREQIPVTRSGETFVNITTLGGPVAVGDYVTSSPVPGKGQKAEQLSGYMVGVALETFGDKDGSDLSFEGKNYRQGRIKIAVGIGPASPVLIKAAGGLFGTLKQLATAFMYNIRTSKQAERIIRYILAALIALLVIYISFRTFGRNVTKGIEAIGRNPLARVSIQSMIVVNVILIFVVSLGGVLLSLAILSL